MLPAGLLAFPSCTFVTLVVQGFNCGPKTTKDHRRLSSRTIYWQPFQPVGRAKVLT